jgi:ketosteroid isomerase-like protein/pimeloyl-ACP methyl ester carboxylesterase
VANSADSRLTADEAAIRKADADWVAAARSKQVDAWLKFYTADAVVLPPNDTVANGREAARKSVGELLGLPDLSITWQPSKVVVARSGDIAYLTGAYSLAFKDAGGAPQTDRGKLLEVWEKQANGKWLCSADTWNSDLPVDSQAQSTPSPVNSDPVPDPVHPPHSAQVLVPSKGLGMNGLFYLAGGPGPHPTMVLLHGFPGNEQNLDLAQAIRRAGWNVLTLHYRGAWGSPGNFSISHVLEDADAAVAFVRRPDIAAKFGIDPRRIVLGGHSMGGFATAAHARFDTDLSGAILIDAWNVGADGEELSQVSGAKRAALAAKNFDDLGNSLHGATATGIAEEIVAHRADWNYLSWADHLRRCPLLVIGASQAGGKENRQLAEAVTSAGGQVTALTLQSDHSFQDRRIALESEIVDWLQKLGK